MTLKTKVLSVDDNPQNILLIEKALAKDFEVISTDGSESLVDLVEEHDPAIILLDIMLNKTTGYELAEELRDSFVKPEIAIIFISALSSIEDKLKAYSSGGDDYICKPFIIAELKEKLKIFERRIEEKSELAQSVEQISNTAFASMQTACELGQLVEFFESVMNVENFPDLYDKLKLYFVASGLDFSCEFRSQLNKQQFSEHEISKLEGEVLEKNSSKKIVCFGKNILLNSSNCSLLVKNVPQDDEDMLNRMKDNFAIVLKILDSRVVLVSSEENRIIERTNALASLKEGMSLSFENITTKIRHQESEILNVISLFSTTVESSLVTLGLDEDQEADLLGIMDDIKEKLFEATGSSVVIDRELEKINQILTTIK